MKCGITVVRAFRMPGSGECTGRQQRSCGDGGGGAFSLRQTLLMGTANMFQVVSLIVFLVSLL